MGRNNDVDRIPQLRIHSLGLVCFVFSFLSCINERCLSLYEQHFALSFPSTLHLNLNSRISNRLLRLQPINIRRTRQKEATLPMIDLGILTHKVPREANIERRGTLQLLDLLVRQDYLQRLNVILQLLDLASTDDRKDPGCLGHDVSKSHGGDVEFTNTTTKFVSDFLKRSRDLGFPFGLLAAREGAKPLALLLACFDLRPGLEFAAAQDAPGGDGHAVVACHGQDVSLEVSQHDVPATLINGEGCLAVQARVHVGCTNNPGGRVGDAEIHDFALFDEDVKSVHDLFDRAAVIPPVEVEDIDVIGLELFEGVTKGEVHGLLVVARIVWGDCLANFVVAVRSGEFGGENYAVPDLAGSHPFADPGFGLFVLIIVGGVDEVAAGLDEGVEELEGVIF